MKSLVKNGKIAAHIHGAPDREALLETARARLASATDKTRASWERQVAALEKTDKRVLVDFQAENGAKVSDARAAAVKAEAERRILAVYPYAKQANIARSAAVSGKTDELAAMDAVINAVRAASAALIASVHQDITSDAHWPSNI